MRRYLSKNAAACVFRGEQLSNFVLLQVFISPSAYFAKDLQQSRFLRTNIIFLNKEIDIIIKLSRIKSAAAAADPKEPHLDKSADQGE